jgi:hypothetical protein
LLTSGLVGGSASSSNALRSAGGNVVFRSFMRIPLGKFETVQAAITQSPN